MMVAFDTNIFFYGVRPFKKGDDESLREKIAASRDALRINSVFWMSPVTAAELLPHITHEEAAAMRLQHAKYLRVDAQVVALASDILRDAKRVPGRCDVCFVPRATKKCGECKNMTRLGDMLNDAIAIAGCVVEERVGRLYTFDQGMIDLARDSRLVTVEVVNPPHPGGPIFEHAMRSTEEPPGSLG